MLQKIPYLEVFLLAPDDRQEDPRALAEAVLAERLVRPRRDDPSQLIWNDSDTGSWFHLTLDPALLTGSPVDGEEGAEPGLFPGVHPDEHDRTQATDLDEEEDDEEEPDEPQADHPPLIANIPLFHPSFFPRVSFEVLLSLAERCGLSVLVTEEGDDDVTISSLEQGLAAWERAHHPFFEANPELPGVVRWSPEKSEAFFAWGRALEELSTRHASDGLAVSMLQAARFEQTIRSLTTWVSDQAAVLPRADLVLVERARERRGILGKRRRREELIVDGETFWKTLAPHGQVISSPTEHLVLRAPEEPSARFTADVENLRGARPDAAKRSALAGVIDIEPPVIETDARAETADDV